MSKHQDLFEPLTAEDLNDLAGRPGDSQHVLARVQELIRMAHEQAARKLCESLLPNGWRVLMGRSTSRIASRSYSASAVGPRHEAAEEAYAVGYGAAPADAYVDLVCRLAERGL